MAFNSLLKLLLELSNQAPWAGSTSEMNLNQLSSWALESPWEEFSCEKQVQIQLKGAILSRNKNLPALRKPGGTEPGTFQPNGGPLPWFAIWSPSTRSSPPPVAMQQAVPRAAQLPLPPLLRNEERFMGLWTGGKQIPSTVNPPPGNEMATCLCF